jgi:predicted acylesterase/phospholipase RssA
MTVDAVNNDGIPGSVDTNKTALAIPFTKLVLSGGSTQAFSFIGCIRLLEERGALVDVGTIAGSSAGALVAFMMILGMSSQDMQRWASDRLIDMHANELDIDDMLDVYSEMGIDKGEKLQCFLGDMCQSRIGVQDVTFCELREAHGKKLRLVICASNLSTSEPEYFSYETSPHVSVITALRASMCLPVFFAPVVIDGMMFADGGLFENLPILGAKEREVTTETTSDMNEEKEKEMTLALNVPWTMAASLPTDLVQYSLYLVTSMLKRANHVTGSQSYPPLSPTEVKGGLIVDIDNDRNEDEPDSCRSRPFLGFCLDSMSFVIDKKQVAKYAKNGYEVLSKALSFNTEL